MKWREIFTLFVLNDLIIVGGLFMMLTGTGFQTGRGGPRDVPGLAAAESARPPAPIAEAAPPVQPPAVPPAQPPAPPKPYSKVDVYIGCDTPDTVKRLQQEPELAYEGFYVGLPPTCVAALKLDFDYKVGVHYGWVTNDPQWAASYALRANHFARTIGAPQPCRVGGESIRGYPGPSDEELENKPCLYSQTYRVYLHNLVLFDEIGQGKYKP